MRTEFYKEYLFPAFLLADKNGYAMACALMRAVELLMEQEEKGLAWLFDVDSMPEWRLDEIAWEGNLLYDYAADIEEKRRIVADKKAYMLFGTKAGLETYLHGAAHPAQVREWFEYNGEPYHFEVEMDGRWDVGSVRWAEKVMQTVKNVRSVPDRLLYRDQVSTKTYLGLALHATQLLNVETPAVDDLPDDWLVNEDDALLLDENGRAIYV